MYKLLFIIPFTLLLSACFSNYPLGMSEKEWKSLTPPERERLLIKQQQYDAEQRLAQIKADAEARKLQHQADMAERQRLERLYQNPDNGNVIMVNILGGQFIDGKRTYNIQEEGYQIARGETLPIKLYLTNPKKNRHSTETVYLQYNINGNAAYLYLDNPKYSSSRYSRISLLRDGYWACGTQYNKTLNTKYEKLIGMKFFVKETGLSCRGARKPYPGLPRKIVR